MNTFLLNEDEDKDEDEDVTVISYFDHIKGPSVLYTNNKCKQNLNQQEQSEYQQYREFTHLMDIHNPGDFFIHYFNGKMSVNYLFSVRDTSVRGKEQLFMITSIIKNKEKYSSIFQEMNAYKSWMKRISHYITMRNELIPALIKQMRSPEPQDAPEGNAQILIYKALLESTRRM